jgi:hypothetical protein
MSERSKAKAALGRKIVGVMFGITATAVGLALLGEFIHPTPPSTAITVREEAPVSWWDRERQAGEFFRGMDAITGSRQKTMEIINGGRR